MKLMKVKFVVLVLIVGLLTACASQTTETPPSQSTKPAVSVTDPSAPATTEGAATTEPVASASVSFTDDVLPILESRCINCHGGNKIEEGLSLRTYGDMMIGSENGPVIVAGDAANSLLADLVTKQKMPKRGPKLAPPQVQLIVNWINQGAQDN